MWSSGKILEYTIKSIISRQQYNEENRVIPRTYMTRKEIVESIDDVIAPFKRQMDSKSVTCEVVNSIPEVAELDEFYLANWDLIN